ncbi:MAG: sulfatase [Pseudomonadales bacterium]
MNILFIMSDDHAATAIGSYRSRLAGIDPTPTIDQLAAQGTLFENAFATNSVCTPSRASILTGQYSHINGARNLGAKLEAARQHLPLELKKAGYDTAVIGKWHISSEPAAFDHYEVLHSQGHYTDPIFNVKGSKTSRSTEGWPNNTQQFKGHSTDVITDRSLKWLRERDQSKPFMLLHHFKAPHGPFENAARYNNYLADVDIPEPETLWNDGNWGSIATRGEDDSLRGLIGSSVSRRSHRSVGRGIVDKTLQGDAYTHASYQAYLKRYLRCVKGIDDNIKRLLDYLDQSGQAKNTIVIYTSDQGMMLGEHDFHDKRWMYEESMRMPLIIYHPQWSKQNKKPSRSRLVVDNTDYAPTLLALAGVSETPEYMQGSDFSAALRSEKPSANHQAVYYRYWMHMKHHSVPAHFGIRTEQYKLIFFYGQPESNSPEKIAKAAGKKVELAPLFASTPVAWEFYDMTSDPHETTNLYGDPKYGPIIANLKRQLQQMRTDIGENDSENFPHIQAAINAHWND